MVWSVIASVSARSSRRCASTSGKGAVHPSSCAVTSPSGGTRIRVERGDTGADDGGDVCDRRGTRGHVDASVEPYARPASSSGLGSARQPANNGMPTGSTVSMTCRLRSASRAAGSNSLRRDRPHCAQAAPSARRRGARTFDPNARFPRLAHHRGLEETERGVPRHRRRRHPALLRVRRGSTRTGSDIRIASTDRAPRDRASTDRRCRRPAQPAYEPLLLCLPCTEPSEPSIAVLKSGSRSSGEQRYSSTSTSPIGRAFNAASVAAPKEQPPRNLSGKRTAREGNAGKQRAQRRSPKGKSAQELACGEALRYR